MKNAELIKALRICANQTCCDNCPRYDIDHTQDAQRCCIQLINDAADALEAAEKRIADLEAQMSKEGVWIKCSERLPEPGLRVLATDGIFVGEAYISAAGNWYRNYGIPWTVDKATVTHWMPMPDAPEVEG